MSSVAHDRGAASGARGTTSNTARPVRECSRRSAPSTRNLRGGFWYIDGDVSKISHSGNVGRTLGLKAQLDECAIAHSRKVGPAAYWLRKRPFSSS